MHIKHMHEMIEKLTDCTKSAIENDQVSVGRYPISDVVDMIKDLNEASYYASIVKAMEEAKKEEEEEEKYMLRMLKDEHKDEYKRYIDEYGEDGERRFYDAWRYKSGRFAPKGHGTRRGYVEPPYYHMTPDMMREHDPEYWRDVDRREGRMYYTPMSDGHTTTHDGTGDVRGYSDGYADGIRDGKKHGESRYDKARRGYEEKKEIHKGNTPEDKQAKMRELEKYTKELAEDVTEMISDATPEERNLLRQKMQMMIQKIPQ